MPEHIEIETQELQEKIGELTEERESAAADAKRDAWIRYVGLSTAILAVFAAIAALQSGNFVNEALIHQLKASDTWSEYQAARQKDHSYTIAVNALLDANAGNPGVSAEVARKANAKAAPQAALRPKPAAARTAEYRDKIAAEATKEAALQKQAQDLEDESEAEINRHHRFEYAVALIQVAIAVGAVAALARVKPVWYVSIIAGVLGIALTVIGFL
jgi:hypothetical protein